MAKDSLCEVLTHLRNVIRVKGFRATIPKTRITQALSTILLQEGLIEEVVDYSSKEGKRERDFLIIRLKYFGSPRTSAIANFKLVRRPGLRFYVSHKEIPPLLGGLGLSILSTSKGLITDREARFRGVGGELICSLWLLGFLI
jgi:small subunit ribosomal protein S8